MGVNNLPRVVVRSRALAGDRTRDLPIAGGSDALPVRQHAIPPSVQCSRWSYVFIDSCASSAGVR